MESIDELRREVCKNGSDRTVRLVADHIGKIEQEIKEQYIELPKDENDKPICVGDKMHPWLNKNRVVEVCAIVDSKTFIFYEPEGQLSRCMEPSLWVHCEPLTVEEVLEDALNRAASLDRKEGYWPSAADITNIVNEIAPKLQLREAE